MTATSGAEWKVLAHDPLEQVAENDPTLRVHAPPGARALVEEKVAVRGA